MAARSDGEEQARWQVVHHERWTRVDRIATGSGSTVYVSADGQANMTVERQLISFRRGREPTYSLDNTPRNTGERQTFLGEPCTVWNAWRTTSGRPGTILSHLSCVTDDEIEVWQRTLIGTDVIRTAEATSLERRPISPSEVEPPRNLLSPDWWGANVAALTAQGVPDHETVMELSADGSNSGKSIRVTRRLGLWQFIEEHVNGVRQLLDIAHDSGLMHFQYVADRLEPLRRLSIARLSSVPHEIVDRIPAPSGTRPENMTEFETVLGETCRWFDTMPGEDGGRSACLTHDGVLLKERRWSRGSHIHEWTAVRFARRPVSLDEIKPPAEVVDPKTWGIN